MFSSERSERTGKRCEPKAVAGPCASGPPVMIEGRKGKRNIIGFRSAAGASAYLFGCGAAELLRPAAPPDHLLLIAVGVVAGVGFGVLAGVIRFGFGVLAG